MSQGREAYPSDVSDAEWEFLAPYLTLMREGAPQRENPLRDVFDAVRYVVKTGCPWDFLPHDFPPWAAVYQQARRWVAAGVFEGVGHDRRMILRLVAEGEAQPTAAVLDARTLQSTPESGARAGCDGAKKKRGSKVHIAVDTLGHLLALKVTAADAQGRARVAELTAKVQEVTGRTVEVAFADQGYTGESAADQAAGNGIRLEAVKHTEAKRGFVLLPRRRVVERTFGWLARFRRPARDYERLSETLAGPGLRAAVGNPGRLALARLPRPAVGTIRSGRRGQQVLEGPPDARQGHPRAPFSPCRSGAGGAAAFSRSRNPYARTVIAAWW